MKPTLGKLFAILSFCTLFCLIVCNHPGISGYIMTVDGPIAPADMGKSLAHEHILVDFIGAQKTGSHRWDKQQVINKVLPFLLQIKEQGVATVVECTPEYLGRDVELLKMLSDSSGLHLLTNTGYYGAFRNFFLPPHAFTESAQQLADRWITEWEQGIGDTGIHPGFIKIAVEGDSVLSDVHRKLVRAAAIAHNTTGLVINCHTGPTTPIWQVFDIIQQEHTNPSAFIWTHATRGTLKDNIELASQGVWISYDKLNDKPETIQQYVELLSAMKANGLLKQVLVSHDAGWYDPAKPEGGLFRHYATAFGKLVPALLNAGFTNNDITRIFTINPQQAYTIKPVQGKD